jgi:hypothetical protein
MIGGGNPIVKARGTARAVFVLLRERRRVTGLLYRAYEVLSKLYVSDSRNICDIIYSSEAYHMPTATLIRRVGSSSSHSSSVVVELVASSSSGGGSHSNSQEVDNCNGKDASISVATSQSKNKIQKEKTVAKTSQPGVKKRIRTIRKRKQCSHEGCTNQKKKSF